MKKLAQIFNLLQVKLHHLSSLLSVSEQDQILRTEAIPVKQIKPYRNNKSNFIG